MKKCFSIIATPFISIFFHRELLKGFVVKEIKGRVAGSFGGLIWTVLTPLATIVSYFFVFSIVLRINVTPEETGTDKFVIFFLCGFFPWTMFAESLSKAVGILVGESMIITKVVFPVELLPVSVVFSTYIINGIGFTLILVYLSFIGYLNTHWFYLPIFLIIEILFTLGFSFFLSAICVFIRDIGELFGIVIMLWFFGTPVIYPVSMVPEKFELIFWLNPMASFVNNFRNCILMDKVDVYSLTIMCVFAVVSYCAGTWFFTRSKNAFGDIL